MDLNVNGNELSEINELIRVKVILQTLFTEQTASRFKQLERRLTERNEEYLTFQSTYLKPRRASITTLEIV